MIRSRPYHPQTQRKCERSHRGVRNKSTFLKQKDKDLTGQLKQTTFALNETPKEVLGYSTPSEVYTSRQNDDIFEKVRKNISQML